MIAPAEVTGAPTVSDSVFTPLVVPRVGEPAPDVREETERARARGYADGFAEGRRIALDEGRRQQVVAQERAEAMLGDHRMRWTAALQALQAAETQLTRRVDDVSTASIERIEELAVELATAILGVELSDPARSAAHAVRRAATEMPVDRWTRVTLNDRDAALLEAEADSGDLADAWPTRVDVVASAAVDPGGAVVEIEAGAVDTSIMRALTRARAALVGETGDGGTGDSHVFGDTEALA